MSFANNGLKNNDKTSDKISIKRCKDTYKNKSATSSESAGYKIAYKKVLNRTSKGR